MCVYLWLLTGGPVVLGAMPTSQRAAPLLASRFYCCKNASPPIPHAFLKQPMGIHTPLVVDAWAHALKHHTNKVWVDSLLTGLKEVVQQRQICSQKCLIPRL